jgi:hypothetical protein
VVGGSIIILTLIKKGSEFKVTHYHQVPWQKIDILLSIVFLTSIILQIISAVFFENSFSYSPYPQLSMPSLNIEGVLLSAIPILPILVSDHD